MKLKPADIIITTDAKSLLSRMILSVLRFFQNDPVDYQHTMLVENECACIEANWKIERNILEDRLASLKKYKILRHRDLTDEQRIRIVEKAQDLLGTRYSVFRMILQLLDLIFNSDYFTQRTRDPNHQICSSLVAWCYGLETGIKFNGVDWSSCEPDDIDDESLRPNTRFETILEWEND